MALKTDIVLYHTKAYAKLGLEASLHRLSDPC